MAEIAENDITWRRPTTFPVGDFTAYRKRVFLEKGVPGVECRVTVGTDVINRIDPWITRMGWVGSLCSARR